MTLGGVGLNKGKRHPTLGNNVTVGCGAKILGAFEVGDNCSIAANAVLLKPLEDNVTAVGIPARPVKKDGVKTTQRNHGGSLRGDRRAAGADFAPGKRTGSAAQRKCKRGRAQLTAIGKEHTNGRVLPSVGEEHH